MAGPIAINAFNRLSQYTSSPDCLLLRNTHCFFPSGDRDHRQYSLRLPTDGWPWPDWVGMGDSLLNTKMLFPRTVTHPSANRARRREPMLINVNALPLNETATYKQRSARPSISDLLATKLLDQANTIRRISHTENWKFCKLTIGKGMEKYQLA